MAEDQPSRGRGPVTVTEGEWAGWQVWHGVDAFEDLVGDYYFRREEGGGIRCVTRCERRHLNGAGFMHGGAIMTFADYCLFMIGQDALEGGRGVTATFNCEFVGAVSPGDLLECTGEVVRGGRSMIFLRGLIAVKDSPVMSFSGVIKRVAPAR
jgi:acyl-coenzyme A thioesterase PaaI-like protein